MKRIQELFSLLGASFRNLSITSKLLIIAALVFGCVIRYVNLFHPGFAFDTVTTQYDWGLNADRLGFVRFWREFWGFFDYLPGALYILGTLRWISKHFGDNAHTFVIALKSMNWLADIGFMAAMAYVANRYGKFSKHGLTLLLSFVYVVPSIWFVSEVWGQFDTLLVLIVLLSVIFLYRGVENKSNVTRFYKDPVFWSGFILACAFWFKLQAALVIPVLILFHLCYRNFRWLWRQSAGFVTGSALLIGMPLLVNAHRLKDNLIQPYLRGDDVTRKASTFWPAVGVTGSGSAHLINYRGFEISVAQVGMLVFAILMIVLVIRYFRIDLRKIFKIKELFPAKLTFLDFSIIMTINSFLYFMLFTKMHSRYLHLGLLFGLVSFAAMGITHQSKRWFWILVFMNIAYFLNQVYVYVKDGFNEPKWIMDFYSSFNFSLLLLASAINIVCLIGMYAWILRNKIDRS